MIDDFKRPPAKQPARLDTIGNGNGTYMDSYPRPEAVHPGPLRPAAPYAQDTPVRDPSYRQRPDDGGYTQPESFNFDTLPEPVDGANVPPQEPPKKRRGLFGRFKKPSRKQALIGGSLIVLLLASGTSYALTRPPAPEPIKPTVKKVVPKPVEKPIVSPLTGLVVTPEQLVRPVTGVMIENSPSARPQSGLKEAGVVFEAISESGITRFLALFQEAEPGNIGPIRSVRPYYLDWVMPFDASIAHVGGSPEALQRIRDIGTKDIDQFHNAGGYHRINTRYAPHNMYSNMGKLTAINTARGYTKSEFTGFLRKDKEEPVKTATARTIDLGISSPLYNPHYDYDAASNSYHRSMGGAAHIDMETKAVLQPKVVVALVMSYGLKANGLHSEYGTTGTGLAYYFQDGKVTTGAWKKADHVSQFEFVDDGGTPVKLNAGQTWISVVSDAAKVTYAP